MAASVAVVMIAGLALVTFGGDDEPVVIGPIATIPEEDRDAGSADGGASTDPSIGPSPGQACPDISSSLAQINAATYAIVAELPPASAGGSPQFVFLGTAWAAAEHVLVTNAHITQEFRFDGIARSLAVQAGTGEVFTLTRELTHPNWSQDTLRSPDVGLFTTLEPLPTSLPLAANDSTIALGADIELVGFPGDVEEQFTIIPGRTVPQATSLTGRITALRSHDDSEEVDNENVDLIQHQAPTTPGTSGSSVVACGQVVGVNNAGTTKLVLVPTADGGVAVDRQANAANSFAVHHRHVRTLLSLFENDAVQGTDLSPSS